MFTRNTGQSESLFPLTSFYSNTDFSPKDRKQNANQYNINFFQLSFSVKGSVLFVFICLFCRFKFEVSYPECSGSFLASV